MQKKKAQKLIERVMTLRAVLHAPFNSTSESFPSSLLPVASQQQYPEARGAQRKKGTILILTRQQLKWAGGLEEAEPDSDEPSKD